jgi:parvulin-like peptidyl-prolyl isomerase
MDSIDEIEKTLKRKTDDQLILILKERSTYHKATVIAAGKILTERGIDLQGIKSQIDSQMLTIDEQKYVEEEKEIQPTYEKYKQEIESRLEDGADVESVKIALKGKGYNGFDMINEAVQKDETVKGNNKNWKKWLTVLGVAAVIIRLLRLILLNS